MAMPSSFNMGNPAETSCAVAVVRDDLTIEAASENFAQWCGREGESLIGMALSDLVDLGMAATDGNTVPVRLATGARMHASFQPVKGDGGSSRLALVLSDTGGLSRAIVRSPADRPTDYTGILAKGLAHKMNNILTIFHGYSSIFMADENLPSDVREGLKEIKKGAEAASELLDRTVAAARRIPAQIAPVSLGSFFKNLQISLAPKPEATHRLTILPPPDDLPSVRADATSLRTVLGELVRNAAEAVGEDGVIEIEARSLPPGATGQKRICIAVRDNGPGISREHADKIFEPFFTMKKHLACLGLGLSMVQTLVEQMGGTIELESGGGQGTEARVTLPA